MEKINLFPTSKLIDLANEFIDSKPETLSDYDGVSSVLANPTGIGYENLIEIFICGRIARIKIGDPEQLIEYQIDLMPWRMGVSLDIWNDGENADSSVVLMKGSTLVNDEAEYFQRMTIEDNSFFSYEELAELKMLMYKIYEYHGITPCKREK